MYRPEYLTWSAYRLKKHNRKDKLTNLQKNNG